jgi:hypothetical protein
MDVPYSSFFHSSIAKLQAAGDFVEEIYQALISAIFGTAIDFFGLNKELCQRS